MEKALRYLGRGGLAVLRAIWYVVWVWIWNPIVFSLLCIAGTVYMIATNPHPFIVDPVEDVGQAGAMVEPPPP